MVIVWVKPTDGVPFDGRWCDEPDCGEDFIYHRDPLPLEGDEWCCSICLECTTEVLQ